MKDEELEGKLLEITESEVEKLGELLESNGYSDFGAMPYGDKGWTFTVDGYTYYAKEAYRAFGRGIWQMYLRKKLNKEDILKVLKMTNQNNNKDWRYYLKEFARPEDYGFYEKFIDKVIRSEIKRERKKVVNEIVKRLVNEDPFTDVFQAQEIFKLLESINHD